MAKPLAVVILGAGTDGAELLGTLLHVPGVEILVIADRDPSSPGFKIAEAAGVFTATAPVSLPLLQRADVILDTGGDTHFVGPIQRNRSLRPKLIAGLATRLVQKMLTYYRRGQALTR